MTMKRIVYIALLMFVVSLAFSQSTIPKNVFSWGVAKNLVSGGSTYFPPVALTATAGAQVLTKGTVFTVAGALKQTSITTSAADAGRIIILITASTDTLVDGGNLKLAGDFPGTANDVLVLIGDGTDWFEVFRSAN
jgi:hypothetical protein